MKITWTILVLVAATFAFSNERRPEQQKITTEQIAKAEIVGALGIPLGTCTRVKATLATSENNNKADAGVYFLDVTEIEGKKVDPPFRSRFDVHFFATKNVKVANGDFGLYELSTGKKTGHLTGDQVMQLQKEFLGKPLRLTVYETCGFTGIPNGLPKAIPPWAGQAYHFGTSLVVVDQER